MAIDYDHIMGLKSVDEAFSYSDRETMLYALGVGMAHDPMNRQELDYVFEAQLKTIPTMATVISWGAGRMAESGINFMMVVHGEQKLTLHQPLPPQGDILVSNEVKGVYDKGEGKGALIITQTDIKLKSGEALCSLSSTVFARGDGGFGGSKQGAPQPHAIPEGKPDFQLVAQTQTNQAILYRLSGDRNPLHIDPEFAKMAGFDRPIIHGLCSYGVVARAILSSPLCDYDHRKIKQFDVRFSAPVFPGETLLIDIWQNDNIISFEAKVKERGVTALSNGLCKLSQ